MPENCLSHSADKQSESNPKFPSLPVLAQLKTPVKTVTCVSGGGAPIGGSIGGSMPGGMGGMAGGL